jgi:hypothetical protein
MIKNDAGFVAMKYFQQVPQRVQIGKSEYRFEVKRNICMAWVQEEHVGAVLDIVRSCCGGHRNKPYRLANEADVRVWSGISER